MERLAYLPESIIGGESIWIDADNTTQSKTDIILADYSPADNWDLNYSFTASTPFTVAAIANDEDTGWTLEVTGAQTLTMQPGSVAYVGIVSKDFDGTTRSFVIDSGFIVVTASPLRVSSWVAVLALVDAAISTFAANPNGSISVDGMSVSYRGMDDLIKLRNYVNYRLEQDSSSRRKRIIRTRFNVR